MDPKRGEEVDPPNHVTKEEVQEMIDEMMIVLLISIIVMRLSLVLFLVYVS